MYENTEAKPLVSAIIIFFNTEKYIEDAIKSVFEQTYENWELLLVDDGSSDRSTEIAQNYAQKYPDKVRYLEHDSHQNLGMSATRNLGIYNAKGDYIAFLDADDVWLPKKLERQLALIKSYPQVKVVFGPTQYWYSWAGNIKDSRRDIIRELHIPANRLFQPPHLLSLLLGGNINTPATCSVLISRDLFTEIGGFEESFKGMYEDQVFFSKVYLHAPVFVSNECLDKYRQHPESSCAIAERKGFYNPLKSNAAELNFLNWVEEYLSKQGVMDYQLWQALDKGLWPYRYPTLYFILYPFLSFYDKAKYKFRQVVKSLI